MNVNPWLPFEWVVAFRFLKEGKIQTAFIVTGISIGVAVIVFMSALLNAMQANFVNRVLTGQAHIQLSAHKEVVRPLYSEKGVLESATLQMPLQRFKSINQWQPRIRYFNPICKNFNHGACTSDGKVLVDQSICH